MAGNDLISVMLNFSTPQKYAKGGLAGKAKEVRDAGRGGDTMLVHVNPIEFKWLKEHFGPGGTNPKTGLPEFSFLDWIIPAVANFAFPGIGTAIGGAIGGMFGLTSPALTSALGSGLFGAGVNALTGGNIGAGAIAGGLSPSVGGMLGLNQQAGLMSNLGIGNPAAAATYSGPHGVASLGLNTAAQNAATAAAAAQSPFQSLTSGLMKAAPLLLAASALTKKNEAPSQGWSKNDPNAQHLSDVKFNRAQTNYTVSPTYGQTGGETTFFSDNALPTVPKYSHGNYVKGGGTGTSDDIPAKLSDGEYVIDAQTVSMLGDGSSDAGAKKLDHMRKEIRKQKGAALSQGKFAPNAKNPLSYLKGA